MSAIGAVCAVTKRELASYFTSPVAYVFLVMFLILVGFFTFMIGNFFDIGQANLSPFFQWHPWLYLVLVPAVGMGLWAEERRSGSIELLLTLPVSPWQAIIGKFAAAWLFLGLALALTFPMVWTVYFLGDPDGGVIATGYCGSFLLGGTYLAIGGLTSATTRNQVVSFITSLVLCLFLVLAGFPPVTDMVVQWAPTWLVDTLAAFSVMTHYDALQRGVLSLRDVTYFASIIGFALFLTSVVLRNRRS